MIIENISLDKLVEFIFIVNTHGFEMNFEINRSQSNKDLAKLFYSMFMKGIVLLYGHNNSVILNTLNIEQIYEIRDKLKKAQIHTTVLMYDKSTSILLDYLTADNKLPEKYVVEQNAKELAQMEENEPLPNYEFRMFVNDHLICLTFDITNYQAKQNPTCFS